ncbi:histidine triad nucleotide-binding protein [Stackebrandtia nassauensis]|uniref:Histidine triad (HIT) protein n=1 Tax=Stackebrandtia nassauensis (strain DSM 44728 / CIP 108903 / NRRL B-16338 / NBRC 102104 / LLR-40K-21) TaxID=446470 RepID=D3PVW2_STANL|nr:histidine triad nucleotide-binding protein [Stackebrandtia nassauensis]ADD45083.1 histidine triad (HIT) protein [Stackebrandtia nassauensis DSM 44728]
MSDCLFCRIVEREIPSTVVAESEDLLAFRDIDPKAPTHVLVIPKAHYANAVELATADPALAGNLLAMAGQIAEAEGVAADGYRLLFNTGKNGGQEVFHVHLHLFGGRPLGPMLAG